MTVHIVTEQQTLASTVIVNASPGERPEKVVELALDKVDIAREKIGMTDPVTEISVSSPQHIESRKWKVSVRVHNTVSNVLAV